MILEIKPPIMRISVDFINLFFSMISPNLFYVKLFKIGKELFFLKICDTLTT